MLGAAFLAALSVKMSRVHLPPTRGYIRGAAIGFGASCHLYCLPGGRTFAKIDDVE
jgi:hypothetical protein